MKILTLKRVDDCGIVIKYKKNDGTERERISATFTKVCLNIFHIFRGEINMCTIAERIQNSPFDFDFKLDMAICGRVFSIDEYTTVGAIIDFEDKSRLLFLNNSKSITILKRIRG